MKIKKQCSTEVGLLSICDPQSFSQINLNDKYEDYFVNDKNILDLMNNGQAVVWGTGGDGTFSVTVRINPEQDLTEDENKLVELKAQGLRLNVSSSSLQIGSPEEINQDGEIFRDIPSGNYLADIYFLYDADVMDLDEAEIEEKLKINPDFDRTGYIVILKSIPLDSSFSSITEVPQLG